MNSFGLRFRLLLVAALLTPAAALGAAFEGKVNFALTTGKGQVQPLTYLLKGDRVRIEMSGQMGMGGMIVDPRKKENIVILDDQRMYLVLPMADVVADAAAAKPGEVSLEKAGAKEKILGYDAEKYVSTQNGSTTELWLAEGLGSFMSLGGGNPMLGGGRPGGAAAGRQEWERALAGKDLFPLRVITKDQSGRQTFKLEATAISKESLADTLFSPPAGYQNLAMGGMMNGLMPGGFPGAKP
jgi:hypothetical protein